MSEIYIVTSGCYSDYGISAVFTDKQSAEDYVKECHKCGQSDASVETWEANSEAEKVCRPAWAIQMFLDGRLRMDSHYNILASPNMRVHEGINNAFYDDGKYGFVCVTSLVSRDHAIKLAIEKRQAVLRTKTEGKS